MGRKLTKKQALEIAESLYSNRIDTCDRLCNLCRLFDETELEYTWFFYWKKINTDRRTFISSYSFLNRYNYCEEEVELLRLLTLHMFIEDVYG